MKRRRNHGSGEADQRHKKMRTCQCSAGQSATAYNLHSLSVTRRWFFLFLPVWLFVVLAVGAAGVYFSYRAPAITAGVIIWTLIVGGTWAYLNDKFSGSETPRRR